ncbi:hypothetical protein [Nonomuraea jabiensis]|uniref:hypothetical protein n=1 Tax=Nonomuraea jabiensis TaxID=882448 RepID=UPI0036CC97D9
MRLIPCSAVSDSVPDHVAAERLRLYLDLAGEPPRAVGGGLQHPGAGFDPVAVRQLLAHVHDP